MKRKPPPTRARPRLSNGNCGSCGIAHKVSDPCFCWGCGYFHEGRVCPTVRPDNPYDENGLLQTRELSEGERLLEGLTLLVDRGWELGETFVSSRVAALRFGTEDYHKKRRREESARKGAKKRKRGS